MWDKSELSQKKTNHFFLFILLVVSVFVGKLWKFPLFWFVHIKTQNSGFFLLGFFYLFFSILRQLKSTSERVLHYQHLRTGNCFNICFSSLLLTQYWDQSSKITSATDKFDNYFGSCGLLPQNSKDKSKRFLLCL